MATVAITSYDSLMARNVAMNVSLTAPLKKYVQRLVRSGRYESASEVIRDALRAHKEREAATKDFWRRVKKKVVRAREQVKQGKVIDGETAMQEILNKLTDEDAFAPPKRKRPPTKKRSR
jgi:antitoxin ParD1/3/4